MVKNNKICISEIFKSIDGELMGAYHYISYKGWDN